MERRESGRHIFIIMIQISLYFLLLFLSSFTFLQALLGLSRPFSSSTDEIFVFDETMEEREKEKGRGREGEEQEEKKISFRRGMTVADDVRF